MGTEISKDAKIPTKVSIDPHRFKTEMFHNFPPITEEEDVKLYKKTLLAIEHQNRKQNPPKHILNELLFSMSVLEKRTNVKLYKRALQRQWVREFEKV